MIDTCNLKITLTRKTKQHEEAKDEDCDVEAHVYTDRLAKTKLNYA